MNIKFPKGPGFIVSLMADIEMACGCNSVRSVPLFDDRGHSYKVFSTYSEADCAAQNKINNQSYYDRYRVIELDDPYAR